MKSRVHALAENLFYTCYDRIMRLQVDQLFVGDFWAGKPKLHDLYYISSTIMHDEKQSACILLCMHVHMYVCMYVCMYVSMHFRWSF